MSVSINTQSSIRIESSKVIYFDPFKISESVHDADVIFITHDHFDHLDEESIQKIGKDDTVFVAPRSIKEKIVGLSGQRVGHFLTAGDEIEVSGLTVKAIPAYNKLKPFHTKGSGFLGYIVTMDGESYYVAGDTDSVKELQEITCDTALVPVGGMYTMNSKEAAKLINHIRPKRAIPTHYGSIVGKKEDGEAFKSLVDPEITVELLL